MVAALPAARACDLEVADPVGDTSPPGLPPYYDLLAVSTLWDNDTLHWSWKASGMPTAINILYFGGFVVAPIDNETGRPMEGTGNPFFHPGCNRYAGIQGIPTTECRLSKSPSNAEGSVVQMETVAELNWSEQGDWLTVDIPTALIDLAPGMGLTWAYANDAVSLATDMPGGTGRVNPVYPDEQESWDWPACWVTTQKQAEAPANPPLVGQKEVASLSFSAIGLLVLALTFVRREI